MTTATTTNSPAGTFARWAMPTPVVPVGSTVAYHGSIAEAHGTYVVSYYDEWQGTYELSLPGRLLIDGRPGPAHLVDVGHRSITPQEA